MLANLLKMPERKKRVIEFESVKYTLYVQEPTTAEYETVIANGKNSEAAAKLIFESETAEAPFFTNDQILNMPPRLSSLLVLQVQEVLQGITQKKT